jgi:hypothetical protein
MLAKIHQYVKSKPRTTTEIGSWNWEEIEEAGRCRSSTRRWIV